MVKYVGFHGSHKDNAYEIVQTRRFDPSTGDDQWLGDGVYFFEDDIDAARWWVESIRQYPQWAILKADVAADEPDILDLLKHEHRKALARVLSDLDQRMREQGKRLAQYRDAEAIDFLCRNVEPNIRIVRGVFDWHTAYTRKGISRIKVTHIQLAVRDQTCIGNLCLVLETQGGG